MAVPMRETRDVDEVDPRRFQDESRDRAASRDRGGRLNKQQRVASRERVSHLNKRERAASREKSGRLHIQERISANEKSDVRAQRAKERIKRAHHDPKVRQEVVKIYDLVKRASARKTEQRKSRGRTSDRPAGQSTKRLHVIKCPHLETDPFGDDLSTIGGTAMEPPEPAVLSSLPPFLNCFGGQEKTFSKEKHHIEQEKTIVRKEVTVSESATSPVFSPFYSMLGHTANDQSRGDRNTVNDVVASDDETTARLLSNATVGKESELSVFAFFLHMGEAVSRFVTGGEQTITAPSIVKNAEQSATNEKDSVLQVQQRSRSNESGSKRVNNLASPKARCMSLSEKIERKPQQKGSKSSTVSNAEISSNVNSKQRSSKRLSGLQARTEVDGTDSNNKAKAVSGSTPSGAVDEKSKTSDKSAPAENGKQGDSFVNKLRRVGSFQNRGINEKFAGVADAAFAVAHEAPIAVDNGQLQEKEGKGVDLKPKKMFRVGSFRRRDDPKHAVGLTKSNAKALVPAKSEVVFPKYSPEISRGLMKVSDTKNSVADGSFKREGDQENHQERGAKIYSSKSDSNILLSNEERPAGNLNDKVIIYGAEKIDEREQSVDEVKAQVEEGNVNISNKVCPQTAACKDRENEQVDHDVQADNQNPQTAVVISNPAVEKIDNDTIERSKKSKVIEDDEEDSSSPVLSSFPHSTNNATPASKEDPCAVSDANESYLLGYLLAQLAFQREVVALSDKQESDRGLKLVPTEGASLKEVAELLKAQTAPRLGKGYLTYILAEFSKRASTVDREALQRGYLQRLANRPDLILPSAADEQNPVTGTGRGRKNNSNDESRGGKEVSMEVSSSQKSNGGSNTAKEFQFQSVSIQSKEKFGSLKTKSMNSFEHAHDHESTERESFDKDLESKASSFNDLRMHASNEGEEFNTFCGACSSFFCKKEMTVEDEFEMLVMSVERSLEPLRTDNNEEAEDISVESSYGSATDDGEYSDMEEWIDFLVGKEKESFYSDGSEESSHY